MTLEDSDSPGRSKSAAAWRRHIHLSNVVKKWFYDVLWCFMYVSCMFHVMYIYLCCIELIHVLLVLVYVACTSCTAVQCCTLLHYVALCILSYQVCGTPATLCLRLKAQMPRVRWRISLSFWLLISQGEAQSRKLTATLTSLTAYHPIGSHMQFPKAVRGQGPQRLEMVSSGRELSKWT